MLNSGLLCLNKHENEKKKDAFARRMSFPTTALIQWIKTAQLILQKKEKKSNISFDLIAQYYHICCVLGFNGKIQLAW